MKRKYYLPVYLLPFACVSLFGAGYASFVMANEHSLSVDFDIDAGEVANFPGFTVSSEIEEVVAGQYFYQDLANKTTKSEAKIMYTIQVDPTKILSSLRIPSGDSN